MSVPTGHAANGVPTGMQIVARPFDDHRVFRAAAAFEAAAPWRGKRPDI
jgi:Asp-tRNA(Asn)/Glu-tRNA(Gln) amidotransferase A subunit family amidase